MRPRKSVGGGRATGTEVDVVKSMRTKLGEVSDPRVAGRTLYSLDEMLVMPFVAVLCGAVDWEAITCIAKSYEK